MNKKYNITKKFLIKEYFKNRKSQAKIARQIGCSQALIYLLFKKYKISSRTTSEATSKELNGNWKDGRKTIKHYCIESDCNTKIHYSNWLYGNKRCGSCAKSGKNHSQWKNGTTSLRSLIHSMREYYNWRTQIFKRDNYICQECGQESIGNIEAHHITSFAELLSEFLADYDQFSPIEDKETLTRLAMKWQPFWDIDNGKTLCEDCHKNIKKTKKTK